MSVDEDHDMSPTLYWGENMHISTPPPVPLAAVLGGSSVVAVDVDSLIVATILCGG